MFRFSGLADLCRFVGYVKQPEERESTVDCRGNWRICNQEYMASFGKLAFIEKDGKGTEDIGKSKNESEKRPRSLCLIFFPSLWLE